MLVGNAQPEKLERVSKPTWSSNSPTERDWAANVYVLPVTVGSASELIFRIEFFEPDLGKSHDLKLPEPYCVTSQRGFWSFGPGWIAQTTGACSLVIEIGFGYIHVG